jgi:hypothetical protein
MPLIEFFFLLQSPSRTYSFTFFSFLLSHTVLFLTRAFRTRGHFTANLDPLNMSPPHQLFAPGNVGADCKLIIGFENVRALCGSIVAHKHQCMCILFSFIRSWITKGLVSLKRILTAAFMLVMIS